MIKSILVTIDGSVYSESVLKYSIDLAKRFKATLRVLTVVDMRFFEAAVSVGIEGFAPIIPAASYQEDSQNLLNQKAEEILKKAEGVLQSTDIVFTLQKENGNPVEVICDKSRLVDLVIMGARGEFEKWSDKMLGATLEAVSRLNIKPILVTPKVHREMKKILLAYDGSTNASKALNYGAYFASVLSANLVLLNVNSSPASAESILKEAREYLSAYDLSSTEEVIVEGDSSEKIIEVANSTQSDLIVMGSYGHSRIREAILGSTTVQVMRKAGVPILMTR